MLGFTALQNCCVIVLKEHGCTSAGDSSASQKAPDGEVVKAASKKVAVQVPEAGE